jgi:hypothetical protein
MARRVYSLVMLVHFRQGIEVESPPMDLRVWLVRQSGALERPDSYREALWRASRHAAKIF